MRYILAILTFAISCYHTFAQPVFIGASFRPYLYDFGGSEYSAKGHFGMKNIDFNALTTLNEQNWLSVTYNQGEYILRKDFTYTLDYHMIKVATGNYHAIVTKNSKHYIGWYLGLNIAPTTYYFDLSFADPLGTKYEEHSTKHYWNLGAEGGYIFLINLYKNCYLRSSAGITFTPNFANPMDGTIRSNFNHLPNYSPAGGQLTLFNVLFSGGILFRLR